MLIPFRIKNWKLALLAMLFIALFAKLGCWQISRYHQKNTLLTLYAAREKQVLSSQTLSRLQDPRYYQVRLRGNFDNAHLFLLDNKIFHGQVGYELYTPFHAQGLKETILVDRGFLPLPASSRAILPTPKAVLDEVEIIGLINTPPRYFALGSMHEAKIQWPLRIEFVQLNELTHILQYPLFQYVVLLRPQDVSARDNAGYPIEWQLFTMLPEKHLGYAFQWFALAMTLLILFVALGMVNRK